MKFKYLTTLTTLPALIALSLPALGASSNNQAQIGIANNQIFIGGQLGLTALTAEYEERQKHATFNGSAASLGPGAEINLGFRHTFTSKGLLGAKIDFGIPHLNAENYVNKVELQYWSDIALLPGYALARNFNLYAELGVSYAKAEYSRHSKTHNRFDISENHFGGVAGIIGELTLTKKTSMTISIASHFYSSKSVSAGTMTTKFSPDFNIGMLGLNHYF